MSILHLPSELRAQIIAYLEPKESNRQQERSNIDDLRNLRLICKALLPEATAQLFHTAHLLPTVNSCRNFEIISQQPTLNVHTRHVVIDTFPVRNWRRRPGALRFGQYWRPSESILNSMMHTVHFDWATAFTIRFSRCCEDDEDEIHQLLECPFSESEDRRNLNLSTALEAVMASNLMPRRRGGTISCLTVANLQNKVSTAHLASLLPIQDVLRELHVSVCTEESNGKFGTLISYDAVFKFWPVFTKTWLLPVTHRLTALSLYCADYWLLVLTTFPGSIR